METIDPWRAYLIVGAVGEVKAIDVRTGTVAWRVKHGEDLNMDLAIDGPRVLVAQRNDLNLTCYDYATGQLAWVSHTSETGRAQIVVDGPQIYCARAGTIDCFGLDGRLHWSARGSVAIDQVAFGFAGNVRQVDKTH